ncbi:MAG TPA: FHA domain-containing protein, partial [Thermomicrobiaceae bacterium]|nr:FHA domain-containing protein [Thermomicrobiaceae bacterium]
MLRVSVEGREHQFDDAQTITVGRDPDSTVQINDPRVSRQHADIRWESGRWIYHDLGSRNGSFRDTARVDTVEIDGPVELRLGDDEYGVVLRLAQSDEAIDVQPEKHELQASTADGDGGDSAGEAVALLESTSESAAMGKSLVAARALGGLSAVYRPGMALARIGRAPDNDIIVDDPLVSRHHAELQRDVNGSFELIDLNSHNGTFLNGQRVTRATVTEADYVNIGHHLFRLSGGTLEAYVDTGAVTFEAHGLTVSSEAGKVLLDDLSFMLGKQSFMAVVGPSGAGKST